MIDIRYLHHIPEEKWDECYLSLINDVYYFYNGIKPDMNDRIICKNGNKYDLSKDNLYRDNN